MRMIVKILRKGLPCPCVSHLLTFNLCQCQWQMAHYTFLPGPELHLASLQISAIQNSIKWNLFMMFCYWIPFTQLLLKFMINLDCWVLMFVMEKPKREVHSKYLGNLSLPKDIGNRLRRYWVDVDHFLKDVSFMKLFLHPCSAMIVISLWLGPLRTLVSYH